MALSEGLKGFMNIFKNGFTMDNGEDDPFVFGEPEEYETQVDRNLALDLDKVYGTRVKPEKSFERESKVVSHPNSYKSGEIAVIEPRSFSEASQIIKKLIDKKTVLLHLDLLDKEQCQRTIDFVCGATYALDGTAQKISDMVFVFTPSNVSLSVESSASQSKFTESLWNKPL